MLCKLSTHTSNFASAIEHLLCTIKVRGVVSKRCNLLTHRKSDEKAQQQNSHLLLDLRKITGRSSGVL